MTEEQRAEPVSWLRLERYHLGELPEEEAREVERALAADALTVACLEEIRKPLALRPLPEPPSRSVLTRLSSSLRSPWPALAVAALAVTALFVVARPKTTVRVEPPSVLRVKGGDVAIEVVRDRGGDTTMNPSTFAEGDRFKVLLTCPPALDGSFDVAVFQDGVASYPFGASAPIVCGNRVPIPGAFTLTGAARALVCVTWSPDPGARGAIERSGLGAVRGSVVCTPLESEAHR